MKFVQPPRRQLAEIDAPIRSGAARTLAAQCRKPDCTACDAHKTCRTVCLWGDGPVPATGMIVYNAPSETDDLKGYPLLDRVAEYLERQVFVIPEIDIQRSTVYITPAVKCRMDNASKSMVRAAQKACATYLEQEIAAVKPKAILAMGPNPYYFFVHRSGVQKNRGLARFDTARNCWVVPTYDILDIFTNPAFHATFIADVAKWKRLVHDVNVEPQVEMITIASVDDFNAMLEMFARDESKLLTFDLETKGFMDFLPEGRVWCAAITDGTRAATGAVQTYFLPLEHPDSPFVHDLEMLTDIVRRFCTLIFSRRVSGHNVTFDCRALRFLARRYGLQSP